jgi:hypothetical protein
MDIIMKKTILLLSASLFMSGCSIMSPSKNYTMDLTSLNNLGHESGCPILGRKHDLKVGVDKQAYWVLSQDCPTKFEALPLTDKFALTSTYSLPKNSKLVGYVFTKKRLEKSKYDFISSISNSALRLGGNKGVIIDNIPKLDEGVTVTAIFRAL